MFREQHAGNHNKSYVINTIKPETVQVFGKKLPNQNLINEEIKSRLRSGNACYHSVQNRLSSTYLYKNIKIKKQRTIVCLLLCKGVRLILSYLGRDIG